MFHSHLDGRQTTYFCLSLALMAYGLFTEHRLAWLNKHPATRAVSFFDLYATRLVWLGALIRAMMQFVLPSMNDMDELSRAAIEVNNLFIYAAFFTFLTARNSTVHRTKKRLHIVHGPMSTDKHLPATKNGGLTAGQQRDNMIDLESTRH